MKQRLIRFFVVSLISLSVVSCGSSKTFAPVADISGYEAIPSSGKYTVASGDTLYSIAWRYGSDYRVLAKNNHIKSPYEIQAGEVIYLAGKKPLQDRRAKKTVAKSQKKAKQSVKSQKRRRLKEPNYRVTRWSWPAKGKVVTRFSKKNNGINIRGRYGAGVYAAAPGKVVYAGDGLRGYGNLIIVKHNSRYLSAYAYNKRLLVKEGQWVKRGQKIAQIGRAASKTPILHFEIRRAGKPVNPLKLLKT